MFENVLGDERSHQSAITAAKAEEARWFSLSLEDKLTELLAKALAMGDLHCAELYRKRLETL